MKTKSGFITSLLLIAVASMMMNFTEKEAVPTESITIDELAMHQSCPQVATYTVKLKTVGGANISPSAVAPNTAYRIHITFSGTYTCCKNGTYCVTLAYGFTPTCNDAVDGSTILNITTDAVLPPFGIIGVVGPTDCSGTPASA